MKACDWSGHLFGNGASPRPLDKKLATPPSSTVYGGQHGTKYVAFELLLHAAFMADELCGLMLLNQLIDNCQVHWADDGSQVTGTTQCLLFHVCFRLNSPRPLQSSPGGQGRSFERRNKWSNVTVVPKRGRSGRKSLHWLNSATRSTYLPFLYCSNTVLS